jgi:hypothetical protein
MKIIILALSFLSLNISAWEYLGVKSGMTRDEVIQVEGFGNKKKTKLQYDEKVMFGGNKPEDLTDIRLSFTPETGVLYKMEIYVKVGSIYSTNLMKLGALERILIDLEISQGMDGELTDYAERGDYGTTPYKVAILLDNEIFMDEVDLLEQKKRPAYLIP